MIYERSDNRQIGDGMVYIRHDTFLDYPSIPPYHPSEEYPEYPFSNKVSEAENRVYSTLRTILFDLGLDKERFGTEEWNPLGEYVSKSGSITIKPNWVWDPPYCFDDATSLFATVTHSSLIRAVVDYAYLAVGDTGKISVLDSPIEDTDWTRLHRWTKFADVMDFFKESTNVPIHLVDLRDFRTIHSTRTIPIGRHRLSLAYRQEMDGDPLGYVEFNLGASSEFSRPDFENYKLLRSPQKWTGKNVLRFHSKNTHTYSISKTVLDSDLLINLPKLKSHKKAGVTLSLKGLIGVTDRKDALPHFKAGFPPKGDEHPLPRSLKQRFLIGLSNFGIAKKLGVSINPHKQKKKARPCGESMNHEVQWQDIRVGDWYGADTLWRTILDINKVVLCGSSKGDITNTRQRKYLSIIDGIIGGEGESPLHPTAKRANLLMASEDPVALDTVSSFLMGFDPNKIPSIRQAWNLHEIRGTDIPVTDVEVRFNETEMMKIGQLREFLVKNTRFITRFCPSIGWFGHIEFMNSTS
ncbi:MAG: DUF362 domain-containing protein [Candidatus Thorarchaeota archaeon]